AALTKSVMTGVGGMTNPDPVTLKFPFPGVLALKGEIVGQEARVAREELEIARRDAVTAARTAYAELLYLRDAQEITRSQLRLIANQQQALSTRYQSGDTGFDSVLKVGIELEQIKEELTSLIEEHGNVEMVIRAVLSLPERIKIGSPASRDKGSRPVGLEALYSLALERRQEIKAKQAMVGKTERMVEMAETMIYPGFTPNRSLIEADAISSVGNTTVMEESEAGPVSSEPGVGAVLPKTPWYAADDAYLRQAREQIQVLTKDVEAERAATLLGVRETWYRMDKAWRQEALYRERITTLAQAGFDTTSQAYAAGRVSFSEFIESANAWLSARLGLARAKADILRSQAELDAAVGVSLVDSAKKD
ncbi:MAG: TolC family protein, partial [Desulfobulbaceae bacterium]|nr:TolC family protein [Desulfobulbaceae bacterium]